MFIIEKLDRQDRFGQTHSGCDILDKAVHLQTIMDAGRRIHEAVDSIDMIMSARLGVHRNDLRCLHLLEHGPATPGEVACKTGLTSGSVTALLDRLEAAGFVERRRSCTDRRSVEIALPDARLAELRALQAEIEAVIRGFYEKLPVADIADSGRLLTVFADALAHFADRAVCSQPAAK